MFCDAQFMVPKGREQLDDRLGLVAEDPWSSLSKAFNDREINIYSNPGVIDCNRVKASSFGHSTLFEMCRFFDPQQARDRTGERLKEKTF